jgi:hypothetical protein
MVLQEVINLITVVEITVKLVVLMVLLLMQEIFQVEQEDHPIGRWGWSCWNKRIWWRRWWCSQV